MAIMDSKKTGILTILGASLMWSLEHVFAKLAYANSDFLQTSAIRAIVVVLTALKNSLYCNSRDDTRGFIVLLCLNKNFRA